MDGTIPSIILLIVIGLIYYLVEKNKKDKEKLYKEAIDSTLKKAKKIVTQNKKQLSIQRKKSVYTDSYGKENLKNWIEKEIPYFINHHIFSKFIIEEHYLVRDLTYEISMFINEEALNYKLSDYNYSDLMTGVEFEFFCSEKLQKEGWKIRTTKNTGDQGVDLIIEKGNRKIGVQCKKYAKPIGNKSVQEIKAGIEFYGLKEGIVLGNNTFTKSAIELGNINNIKLIHYLDTRKI